MARDEAYRKAEQKIEETRRSGAKKLDLDCRFYTINAERLTELPESLGQLTQLQSLDLSNNQLTMLPEWLCQLTQLQSLNLSRNQFKAVPESLGRLAQLQSLDLSDNQLATLPEWLCQLTQLQSLNLSKNQFKGVPESLGRLAQLQSLNLSGNQLTALPEWLGELSLLQWLEANKNSLTELPKSLGQLSRLRGLDLRENELTNLPQSLSKLECLQQLLLGSSAHSLDKYYIGKSGPPLKKQTGKIRIPPKGGEPLPVARLGTIPECIRGMRNLAALGLTSCGLTELPAWLYEFQSLDYCELYDNPLDPELTAIVEQGQTAVKRYLHELGKGAKKRYEAKLLILGDGNEGKTCVSRAIRGLRFRKQVSTRGVDVAQW